MTVAGTAAWYGALRRGSVRVVGLAIGALGLGAAIVLLASDGPLAEVLVVVLLLASLAAARAAFAVRTHLPSMPAPRRRSTRRCARY